MSVTFSGQMSGSAPGRLPGRPVRRVRHEVRDGIVVIAFSAAASCGLALALMLFVSAVG